MPTPPWIDRAIAAVAPRMALQRAQARARLSLMERLQPAAMAAAEGTGYASTDGRDPFMRRWAATARDAAADTLRGLPTQRAQSRDLVRNNGIAASAVNTSVIRAVGTGLALSAQPHLATLGWTAEQGLAWRRQVQAEFSLWADSTDCDWSGEQTFYGLQDLVLRAVLESGDAFTLLPEAPRTPQQPYRLRLQVLEADRCGNPNNAADTADVAGGVRRAAGGGPALEYHFYIRHPGALTLAATGAAGAGAPGGLYAGRWVPRVGRSGRRAVLHHFKRRRPEQPRGVPYLAPVIGLFKLLGDYTDAELKAAVVSAFVALVIETPGGVGVPPIFGAGDPRAGESAPGVPAPGGPAGNELELAPGAVLGLASGEKAIAFNPQRPNAAFRDFVAAVLDQIGAGTFIGPEMLLKKFSTSYTAARAAFLDAWKHLLDLRTLIAVSFCQPVYETWLAEAVGAGRVQAPGFFADPLLRWAYTRAAWQGDSQGSLNPRDEVNAYRDAVDARLMTRERAEWELWGTDWNDTYDVKLSEYRRLEADGMLPLARPGTPVGAAPESGGAGGSPAARPQSGAQDDDEDDDTDAALRNAGARPTELQP